MPIAFQDFYPDRFSHCYGCGKSNPQGHHLKSYWDGEETIARFTPGPQFSGGVPNHVYGGLIASLFDCHGNGSAAGFAHRAQDREMGQGEPMRFVTASLKVDFLRPTPMGVELVVRAKLLSLEGRKVRMGMALSAGDVTCATSEMLAIQLKD